MDGLSNKSSMVRKQMRPKYKTLADPICRIGFYVQWNSSTRTLGRRTKSVRKSRGVRKTEFRPYVK